MVQILRPDPWRTFRRLLRSTTTSGQTVSSRIAVTHKVDGVAVARGQLGRPLFHCNAEGGRETGDEGAPEGPCHFIHGQYHLLRSESVRYSGSCHSDERVNVVSTADSRFLLSTYV